MAGLFWWFLAAIGALSYFGILNPSRFTPDTCMGTSGVSCAGKPIVTNNSIWFTMVNGMGYTLTPVGHNYSAILSQATVVFLSIVLLEILIVLLMAPTYRVFKTVEVLLL